MLYNMKDLLKVANEHKFAFLRLIYLVLICLNHHGRS